MATAVKKEVKNKLPKHLERNFEKKQLFFQVSGKKFQPTPEYVVVDTIDNSIIRPCKESYVVTQNKEILEGVEEASSKLGFNVCGMAPFKTNEAMFVFIDPKIEIPTLINHLVSDLKIFIIEGNSEDVSLSSGIILTLTGGNEVMYHNSDMKSGTRSSKPFANRKYVIPTIIQKSVNASKIILNNLVAALDKTASETFVDDNYRKGKDGKAIKGDNGKFESNIIDVNDFMKLYLTKYSDKSLAGHIIGYMNAVTSRFTDVDNFEERYTQMFITQSSINKKVIPMFDNFLMKKKK